MEKTCFYPECNNIARWSKKIDYKLYRGKYCDKHHHEVYNMKHHLIRKRKGSQQLRKQGFGMKCEICGWEKEKCDIHRKDPGGSYTGENVITLCPNCHRLAHIQYIQEFIDKERDELS